MDNLTLAKKRIASLKSNHDLTNHSITQDVQPIEVRPFAESARYVRIRQAAESSQSILVRQTAESRTKERTHQEKVEIVSKYHILKNGVQNSLMFPSQITPQMKVHEFFNILQMTEEERNNAVDAMEKEIVIMERQKSLENEKNQHKLEMEREREQTQYIEREKEIKKATIKLFNNFDPEILRLSIRLFTWVHIIKNGLIKGYSLSYILPISFLKTDIKTAITNFLNSDQLSPDRTLINHEIYRINMFIDNLHFKNKEIEKISDPIERQKSKDFEKAVLLSILNKERSFLNKIILKRRDKFENEVQQEVQRRLSRK